MATRTLLSAWIAVGLSGVGVAAASASCSSSNNAAGTDSGADSSSTHDGSATDSTADSPADASTNDAVAADSANDAAPTVIGLQIVTTSGAPLQAAAGDAVPLKVVLKLSDGTTSPLPPGSVVTWTEPSTVVAQDPNDAGSSILPTFGADPTGFFVQNPFRPERTDYAGTLLVVDPGSAPAGTIAVAATVGDGGIVTATLNISPTPAGSPEAGADLFQNVLVCAGCHGETGDGTPSLDAGPDGSVQYDILGTLYAYPAPGLNNTSPGGSPNLAADPGWNAALLAMAAQADMDNNGVALRKPMPDWLGKQGLDGGPLGAQDFAHIYAFLQTQTQ